MFGNFGEKPSQEVSKSTEEQLVAFARTPLSDTEVLAGLEQAGASSISQLPTLFQKMIGTEHLYRVQGVTFGDVVEHTMVFTLNNQKTNTSHAELEFEQDVENGVWNMRHRYVATKEQGLSGSDFLKKAEEYFAILKKHQKVDLRKFVAHASQPSVMLWLEKNGFKESGVNFNHLFDYEKGTVIPAPGYFFIELKDPKVPIEKDPYLVNGDFLLDPEFAKLREGLSFDLADKRPYLESIEVLNSLITKGYVPRLSYEKNVL